jgi:gamma-glutamyltranspeptidase/glutathione hydrolase
MLRLVPRDSALLGLCSPRVVAFALLCAACPRTPEPAGTTDAVPSAAPEAVAARRLPSAGDHPGVAVGIHGAVASAEAHASDTGIAILEAGGNAVDAAVAVGFALAVTHPSAGNIGGGGFMVVRMDDGTLAAIDYRERAPGKAHRDMYIGKDGKPTNERLVGPKAAGIPGSVAGLALVHAKFGKLPWKDVVMPAVKLAEEGHTLDDWHAKDLANGAKHMREEGFAAAAKYYEKPDGTPYAVGERWAQPELGKTLRTIAEKGGQAFYEGELAERLATGVSAAGGIWTAQDLRDYKAVERTPIEFDYRGHHVITMPPPSAGGVVLRQLLAAAEVLEMHAKPWRSVDEVHLYVESARRTYADRNLLLADPDFVDLPMEQLLDVSYVKQRLADVDPRKATPSSAIKAGIAPTKTESHQTTHYSVVDEDGTRCPPRPRSTSASAGCSSCPAPACS